MLIISSSKPARAFYCDRTELHPRHRRVGVVLRPGRIRMNVCAVFPDTDWRRKRWAKATSRACSAWRSRSASRCLTYWYSKYGCITAPLILQDLYAFSRYGSKCCARVDAGHRSRIRRFGGCCRMFGTSPLRHERGHPQTGCRCTEAYAAGVWSGNDRSGAVNEVGDVSISGRSCRGSCGAYRR